jgi:hypothetical protein
MNDREIEQRFHLMHKEFEASATRFKDAKAEMAAAIDAREIENEISKRCMQEPHRVFADIRQSPRRSHSR